MKQMKRKKKNNTFLNQIIRQQAHLKSVKFYARIIPIPVQLLKLSSDEVDPYLSG